ncbi:MAG: hypothetical protein HY023_17835 [Chloroflexi bacterium]|nr:hypothetical protein [Chloroflexota bacterium]
MAKSNWLGAIRLGLIGGVIAVLVALVGMVEVFGERDIVAGVISMGQTLLVLTVLLVGYITASRTAGSQRLVGVASGALAGLLTSAMLVVLLLIGKAVNLRPVLINASPVLYKILTFGQDTGTGVLILLALGLVIGAVAGIIHWLPPRIRDAVIAGLLLVGLICRGGGELSVGGAGE